MPSTKEVYYSEACDVWSLGVLAHVLLAGYSPFADSTRSRTFEKVRKGDFSLDLPMWEGVSDTAKDFVRKVSLFALN